MWKELNTGRGRIDEQWGEGFYQLEMKENKNDLDDLLGKGLPFFKVKSRATLPSP